MRKRLELSGLRYPGRGLKLIRDLEVSATKVLPIICRVSIPLEFG